MPQKRTASSKRVTALARHLVVAFQGGLSPQVRHAANLIQTGALGELLTVTGLVWQGWKESVDNTWRVVPEISGGGFMFDSGAHMLNTVCTLVGEDFASVAAWMDNRGMDVDINAAIMGRLEFGRAGHHQWLWRLHPRHGIGDICVSDRRCHVRTGVHGERLFIRRAGETATKVEVDLPTDARRMGAVHAGARGRN